ncbi:hypothetical protein SVAN01_03232 [Stagonosporopsis vannaccii]|nr:hypothetical protein SVAN01_03232 [Stagonosporopsis vannaccii]
MLNLPADVQIVILEHVNSGADLHALCLACKDTRTFSTLFL